MKDKISYFNTRCIFSGIVISYIFLYTSSSFWISYIIGTLIGLLIIYLYNNKSYKIFKIISSFFISFLSCSLLVNMGHSLYLNDTPIWLLTLIPIIAVLIMSNTKTKPFINIANIFFIYALILFFIAVIGLIPHVDIEYMRPLFISNAKNVIWCSLVFGLSSSIPVITMDETFDKKNTILYYLLSSLTLLITAFFAISVLGLNEVKLYRFPEFVVLKRIEFLNFISNVDIFINFAIILDIILTFTKSMIVVENNSNKYIKYFVIILIGILTYYSCYLNWPLIILYDYFPYVLIFLLIILFIPKISEYKK